MFAEVFAEVFFVDGLGHRKETMVSDLYQRETMVSNFLIIIENCTYGYPKDTKVSSDIFLMT